MKEGRYKCKREKEQLGQTDYSIFEKGFKSSPESMWHLHSTERQKQDIPGNKTRDRE